MTTTKKTLLAAAMSAAFGIATPAWAGDIINFDPDGLGGAFTSQSIDAFDWLQGNTLALNGNVATLAPGSSVSSVALGHSILSAATLGGSNIFGGASLEALDITFVFSLPETVTAVTSSIVSLALDAANISSPNFFEIYVGGSSADPLLGTGYNVVGGATLILAGTISASTGIFQASDGDGDESPIEVFDQAGGTNNYPGVFTVEGNGSTDLTVNVTSFDDDYFTNGIDTLRLSFNTSLVNPFRQIDPSASFYNGTILVGANIGTLNGGVSSTCAGNGNCDFQFQSDANNDFTSTSVPEPGSLALLGIGLLGLGGGALRGKRKSMAS